MCNIIKLLLEARILPSEFLPGNYDRKKAIPRGDRIKMKPINSRRMFVLNRIELSPVKSRDPINGLINTSERATRREHKTDTADLKALVCPRGNDLCVGPINPSCGATAQDGRFVMKFSGATPGFNNTCKFAQPRGI